MRTGLAAVALLGGTMVLGAWPRVAAAEPEATGEQAARMLFERAQTEEDRGDFEPALLHDRASVAAAPDSVWAQRAAARVAWLVARSEGDFEPLALLERVRRSPSLAADPDAVDALARDAEAFPPGQVRAEARMFVAEAYLGRTHRPTDALPLLRAVSDDSEADPLSSRLAEREIVDTLVGQGRLDEASAEATSHANRLDPRFVKQTRALVRRRTLRNGALAELGGFAALAGIALFRAFRRGDLGEAGKALRRLGPVAVAFAVYLAAAGGLLASQYESGNAAPFALLAVAVLPLLVIARAWGSVGSTLRGARAGRAVLCAVSVFAAAFVLLDAVNPSYLEGFGL
jgi:hypothetical protein